MIICGIDWSLSCPAITVFNGESFSVDACKFYFYNDKKKFMGHPRFIGTQYDEWENFQERYLNLATWALSVILPYADHVYIEDYALGVNKGAVFNIAECTQTLKLMLYKLKIPLTPIPPTVIKKFYTGKGTAKKQDMEKVFIEETGLDIKKALVMTEKQENPSSDIIDSFAICKLGYQMFTTAK